MHLKSVKDEDLLVKVLWNNLAKHKTRRFDKKNE